MEMENILLNKKTIFLDQSQVSMISLQMFIFNYCSFLPAELYAVCTVAGRFVRQLYSNTIICLQVWGILYLSSNIWSSTCVDSLHRPWEKRLQCWRSAPWNGSYTQANWFSHRERQGPYHCIHQEVSQCTSLGGSNRCGWWVQSGIWGEWNDTHNPEEIVATRRRFTGLDVILWSEFLWHRQHLQLRSQEAKAQLLPPNSWFSIAAPGVEFPVLLSTWR